MPSRVKFQRSLVWLSTVLPATLCLVAIFMLSPTDAVRAQEQEPEVILPACEIRYPGGYDPNTVGVVEGRVASIGHPPQGPVPFRLEAAEEAYTVLTAPAWYWRVRELVIRDGDHVRVKGSKTMGADGNLYLVAQEITGAGAEKPVILRDALGKPAWSGYGHGGRDRRDR